MPDIAASLLTSGSTSADASFYDTASISPSANKIILAICATMRNTVDIPSTPSVTGNGLTWVLVATQTWDHAGTDRGRISVFRAVGPSPSSGAVRFTYSETQRRQTFAVVEFDNVDVGNGGADAVVQSATAKLGVSSAPSVTLAAFSDLANATVGLIHVDGPTNPAVTPGSGYAEIVEISNAEGGSLEAQFAAGNLTLVDWTLSLGQESGVIGIELKNVAPTAPPVVSTGQGRPSFISGNLIT